MTEAKKKGSYKVATDKVHARLLITDSMTSVTFKDGYFEFMPTSLDVIIKDVSVDLCEVIEFYETENLTFKRILKDGNDSI